MNVLIKGFVMPTKREECPFCDYEDGTCHVLLNVKDNDEIRYCIYCIQGIHSPKDRPKWCPLIEIPDHDGNDLISRQAAIDALTDTNLKRNVDSLHDSEMNRTRRAAQRVIAQLPPAQSEIIRCKDCKHKPTGSGINHDIKFPDQDYRCPCRCEDYWYSWIPDDYWFCANGERREE